MSEERRQFGILFRHFVGGFLDNDMIAPATDLHGPLSKAVAVLAIVGVIYPFKLLATYGRPYFDYATLDAASWNDKCSFVTLSLVVTGLLTVLEWDALQLDRRDCRALGALPIRSRTVLWAKFAALGTFLLFVSSPLTLVGALTFPVVMHANWSAATPVAMTVAGHAVAAMAASWFAFFGLLAVRSVLQLSSGQRLARRLAGAVQLVATLGLVLSLLMLPFIASSTAELKRTAGSAAGFAPQMWFMGIYQTVAGQGDAQWALLASRGWTALALAAGLGIGASVLANRRVLETTLEVVQAGGGRSFVMPVATVVGRVLARHPVERGFFSFTVMTLLRSSWHRLVLAVFVGIALALSMVMLDVAMLGRTGLHRVPMRVSHALAMQWVVLAIVLAGVRVAASVPAELRASWVLRMIEGDRPARWMDGFRKAVFAVVALPVVMLMAAATAWRYDGRTAWTLGLAALGFGGVAFEVLFLGFGRVPFACPTKSETGEVRIRGPVMVGLFTVLVVPVADLITLACRSSTGTAMAIATAVAAIAALRWRTDATITSGGGLAFQPEDQGTQALGL